MVLHKNFEGDEFPHLSQRVLCVPPSSSSVVGGRVLFAHKDFTTGSSSFAHKDVPSGSSSILLKNLQVTLAAIRTSSPDAHDSSPESHASLLASFPRPLQVHDAVLACGKTKINISRIRDERGRSVMHYAVQRGNVSALEYFAPLANSLCSEGWSPKVLV